MKKFYIFLVVILIGIQFIPLEQSSPPVQYDLIASNDIKNILRKGCYDCHSNETNWAWYTKVAPLSWLTTGDVNKARKKLNFSDWGLMRASEQAKMKEEIWEEVREESMPPWQYRIMHPSTKLSIEEKNLIRSWAMN
ncbi:MAG TPA: heme-binding domain-containing protein [Ignavibacteriaceae bacterium]|nr:heme-binding domain-containing protein [Ignavibacteriaceae bacterium]